MDEELQLLYGIRKSFNEMNYSYRENSDLKNVYSFNGGVTEKVPTGQEGTFNVDGLDRSVRYTLDRVAGRPLLRMSHSFDEIEAVLNSDGHF